MKTTTTISLGKTTRQKLQLAKRKLKSPSYDGFLNDLLSGIEKSGWTSLDLQIFSQYGKLPTIVVGKAKDQTDLDKQLKEAFGEVKKYSQTGPKVKGEVKKP